MTTLMLIAPSRWQLKIKLPIVAVYYDHREQFAELVEWIGGRVVNNWLLKRQFKFPKDHRRCWVIKSPDVRRPGEYALSTLSDAPFRNRYSPITTEAEVEL